MTRASGRATAIDGGQLLVTQAQAAASETVTAGCSEYFWKENFASHIRSFHDIEEQFLEMSYEQPALIFPSFSSPARVSMILLHLSSQFGFLKRFKKKYKLKLHTTSFVPF